MALPKQSTPLYQLTIPSTGKKVNYRPFLVKDEKALLIASQSEDTTTMIETLKEVIRNCTTDSLDVNSLALFDIEYIFCKLRAKSVGEIIELNLKCKHCEKRSNASIDISDVEVLKPESHKKKFTLFDKVGISMKYPNYQLLEKIRTTNLRDSNNVDFVFAMLEECIDYIYDDEKVYYAKETKREELEEFVNNLTKDQLAMIINFFNTMPKLKKDIEHTCPSCGQSNHYVLEGINNFF